MRAPVSTVALVATATSLSPSTTPSTSDPTPQPSVAPVVPSIVSEAPTATATLTAGTLPPTQSSTPTESSTVCTSEFRPVCGADGSTYSNQCVAASQGVAVASSGACSADLSEDPRGSSAEDPGGSSDGPGLPLAAVVGLGVLFVGLIVAGVAWQRHRRLKEHQHLQHAGGAEAGLYAAAVTLNPEYAAADGRYATAVTLNPKYSPGAVSKGAGCANPEYGLPDALTQPDDPVYAVPGAVTYAVPPVHARHVAQYDHVPMMNDTDYAPPTETSA